MLYLSWLDVSDAAGLHHLPALQQIFSWLIYLLSSGKVMLKYLTGPCSCMMYDDDEILVLLVEETGVPGRNHRPTAST